MVKQSEVQWWRQTAVEKGAPLKPEQTVPWTTRTVQVPCLLAERDHLRRAAIKSCTLARQHVHWIWGRWDTAYKYNGSCCSDVWLTKIWLAKQTFGKKNAEFKLSRAFTVFQFLAGLELRIQLCQLCILCFLCLYYSSQTEYPHSHPPRAEPNSP